MLFDTHISRGRDILTKRLDTMLGDIIDINLWKLFFGIKFFFRINTFHISLKKFKNTKIQSPLKRNLAIL